MTTSVAAIAEFVKVNDATAAVASVDATVVIVPQTLLRVTEVVMLVACVTVPPAPVAYPTPPVAEVDRIDPVAATLAKLLAVG